MEDENTWYGPPHEESDPYIIKRVTKKDDLSCDGGWICEHRWRQTYNMVKFRQVVGDAPVVSWWDNDYQAIAFGREGKGFLALNNEDYPIDVTIQTSLPSGAYCDVISGSKQGILTTLQRHPFN